MTITQQKLLVGLLLLIGFTALYTHTHTEVHTFDALSYTQDVETKPFGELYHPHHLLYGVVGRIAFDAAQTLGYDGRADQPIQFLNALAGAIGVILFWRFGGSFTGHRWLPLSVAVLLGMCYAYWLYATEVEVYTFAVGFIIAALYILTLLERQPKPLYAVLLGLAHAGAVMFHQTNILFALPLGLFLLVTPSLRRHIPVYGLTLGAGVGIPYLLVGWFSGFRNVDEFYTWLTDYAQTGTWGGYLGWDHRYALRDGLLNTISLSQPLAVLFYGLVIVGFALGVRRLGRGWQVLMLSWLVLYGGFFGWWEPWNIEFWIALLPLWGMGMLAGMLPRLPHPLLPSPKGERELNRQHTTLSDDEGEFNNQLAPLSMYGERSGVRLKMGVSISAFILALLLFNNHYDPIRRAADSANDIYQQMTLALKPILAETDLVITHGNILDLYLPFYAEHPPSNVLSLRNTSAENIFAQIDHAHRRGQIIYIDPLMLDETRDGQRNPFGFSAEQIAYLRATYPISENGVFDSIGERAAPDSISWNFERHLNGWLEFGAKDVRFENGGWCISGGNDPWIESPPLTLDADRYKTVIINMYLSQPAGEGQLFWRHADEGLDEARSRRFILDGGHHIYTFDLTQENGWHGEIVFLRFDPIPENVNVDACIYELEFQP